MLVSLVAAALVFVAALLVTRLIGRKILSGKVAVQHLPNQAHKAAEEKAAEIRRAAAEQAQRVKVETRKSFDESLDRMAHDLSEMGEQLERREQTLRARDEAMSERRKAAQAREATLKERQAKTPALNAARADAAAEIRAKLVERSGLSEADVVHELVSERVQEANLRATELKLTIEESVKADAEKRGKRIISIANERFNMSHQPDKENPGYRLSDPEIVEKIGKDAVFKEAFLQAIDAELTVSDDGQWVDVRSIDPLKREIARRTLVYMRTQGVVHPDRIPTVLQRVQKEVDKELEKAADRAVRLLKIAPLEGEVKRLFSRLLYRASYSQNQWHHAVEVAFVCGAMAAEMGLDVKTARRAGLLHDIGKAMTHDHEGSHALLGADVARRQGESEEVANAIAAHHGEEPNISPYAEITAAGDAISGARPGARREIQEAFNSKVYDLERIAREVRGVQRVHVMQGGREVRVFVGEREVKADVPDRPQIGWEAIYGAAAQANNNPRQNFLKDEDMWPIARQIAEQIEAELTYPGQIRVTVIRETRAIGTAR